MSATTHSALILGLGNALRGDDGIGRYVVERLEGLHVPADLDAAPHLMFEHALRLHHYDAVLFVDASIVLPPGQWDIAEVTVPERAGNVLSHSCTPGELLGLTRVLYGHAPRGFLLSIGAAEFDRADHLSDAVSLAVADILSNVRIWLREQNQKLATHPTYDS